MARPEPASRASPGRSSSVWVLAALAVLAIVGLIVWGMSEPTSRSASSPESAADKTTGLSPSKAPPASTGTAPATQGSQR